MGVVLFSLNFCWETVFLVAFIFLFRGFIFVVLLVLFSCIFAVNVLALFFIFFVLSCIVFAILSLAALNLFIVVSVVLVHDGRFLLFQVSLAPLVFVIMLVSYERRRSRARSFRLGADTASADCDAENRPCGVVLC